MNTMGRAMSAGEYAGLRSVALQARNVERAVNTFKAQVRAFGEAGWPEAAVAWTSSRIPELEKVHSSLRRACAGYGADTALGEYVRTTPGLGPAVFYVAGLLPPLADFACVAGLWKYTGLHVSDGRAPKMQKGVGGGFNPQLRAAVLYRLANPAIKRGDSPYRAVYLARKAHTLQSHPDMLEKGACPTCDLARGKAKSKRTSSQPAEEGANSGRDCANVGGVHWSKGHRHNDALRVVAKAILRDLWLVEHGRPVVHRAIEELLADVAAAPSDGVHIEEEALIS